ncbi:amidase [Actinomadura madurae]|uniref:amidase n=1 Tax=Actinomadura madurae TaxID=1993 RepID=UPI0020D22B3E|nr:amidase [Actinomadura madurae]MCP9951444.1 amidase [Actinomadura madurae]MCP9968220.1 amidase [Actinomadura madurae]MCP9980678.1 amidase [Actinomadura madurae]MCQ0007813.1 amidase [Actinomadura madurae]MCQ0016877.1 amidase [Actinomadura madurae]
MSEDDAVSTAARVRRGESSPGEEVANAIARVEALDGTLNVLVSERFERAMAQSEDALSGPFRGVPILVTDLRCEAAGEPYYAGMGLLARTGWTAETDAYLTGRLRAAGFVRLGRTNTPELGMTATTEPAAFGPTRNPWDHGRSPGGSSGGSAAAVASGMVPVAHGTDAAGGLRVPAAACGVVGLKPSRGRISLGPAVGESLGFVDTDGFITRTVTDAAAVLDAVAGSMPGDPCVAPPPRRPLTVAIARRPARVRVGLWREAPHGIATDPRCAAAAESAAGALAELGHEVEVVRPPALQEDGLAAAMLVRAQAAVAAELAGWERRLGRRIEAADVEPLTWALAEGGRARSALELHLSLDAFERAARGIASWCTTGHDILLSPTTPMPPAPLGTAMPADPAEALRDTTVAFAFTRPFNVTGQPAISIPVPWRAGGVPQGVQLVAAYGREDLLLGVAAELEHALPGPGSPPGPGVPPGAPSAPLGDGGGR